MLATRRLLPWCLVLLCCAAPSRVAASELIVEWTAPPECPGQAELLSRLQHSLGDTVTGNLTARTLVSRDADRYRALVSFTSVAGAGVRTLDNASCEILTDSVALVIALSAASSSPGAKTQADKSALDLAIAAHGTVLTGALPKPALGLGGALAIEGSWGLRFELSGTHYAKQSATFAQSRLGADFKLLRFGVRGCRPWRLGTFDVAPCVGAALYRIDGSGFGGDRQEGGTVYVWAPMLGAFGRLRMLSWLALTLSVEGAVPLTRDAFVYPDRGALHRPSLLFLQLFLAPEVQF